MLKIKKSILLLIAAISIHSSYATDQQVITDFLNNRFGMFIHFNMGTFHAEQWAEPNHDPKSFNPIYLNCDQWAEGAASARMSYAVFTTKHHDGFCLWDSATTEYDVANSSYNGDIVKEYADAFRKKGIKVGLYYSVWDRTEGIAKGKVTSEHIEFIKSQLTELLTNYGDITCLVIDGWGSIWGQSPTFEDIPFATLADHIHSLQPNCLVINHSCKTDREYTEIVHYEATHGQHCPYDNTIPSQQGPTLQPAWFWEKGYEKLNLKPLDEILSELEFCNSHSANYLLNAAPNAFGMMDDNVMRRLSEIGEAWIKPMPIDALPKETAPNAKVKIAASSTANKNLVHNVLDADLFTVWEAAEDDTEPTLTLDFGKEVTFNKIICGEASRCNNIEEFEVQALVNGKRVTIATGDKMNFHWARTFEDVTARKFYVIFKKFSKAPKIAEVTFIKYNRVETQKLSRSGERNFNLNWKFALNDEDPEAYFQDHDDEDWRKLDLPHDWSIEHAVDSLNGHGATAYLMGGTGWYRKSFITPQKSNQRAIVMFDGVYNNSEIWINGKLARTHPYGYSPFSVDITDYLLPYERSGEYVTNVGRNASVNAMYTRAMTMYDNVLAVKVNRERHIDSRWYTGSGIYRNVRLLIVDNLHIPAWGTFVTTPVVSKELAEVSIDVELKNCYDDDRTAQITTEYFNPDGKLVAKSEGTKLVSSWDETILTLNCNIENPELWSTDSPKLYTARTTLSMDGEVLEVCNTTFGIRSIKFDPDKGFFLNGESMKIKGICLHHDGGLVGAAVPKEVWRRRLITIKESGCNAVRIAHNPASDELLDLCDELGFLVQEEFFDEWDNPKDKRQNLGMIDGDYPTTGYTEHFQEWAERDVKSVIKRSRNHPSIFQWSIGNEIEWCYINSVLATGHFSKDQKGNWFHDISPYTQDEINELYFSLIPETYDQAKTAKKLVRWSHEMDTTRYVTANYILPSASLESGAIECLDMAGFSYRASLYDRAHERIPEKPIMGTENRATWNEWKAVLDRDFIAGIFIWTGVDYLGEAHNRGPFPKISTQSGFIDLIGLKKPTFYQMQSMWSDEPMVKMYSWRAEDSEFTVNEDGEFVLKNAKGVPGHLNVTLTPFRRGWSYEDGESVMIDLFTNCEEVELFLNGKSLGRKSSADFMEDRRMKWLVAYSAGKLEAKAYNSGKVVATEVIESVGKAVDIRLDIDKLTLNADGEDIAHIVAQLVDSKGREIKDEEDIEIEFIIDGECRHLGVDNGFQENINPFQTTKVESYQGHAMTIIQSTRNESVVTVKAVCPGFESDKITINITK